MSKQRRATRGKGDLAMRYDNTTTVIARAATWAQLLLAVLGALTVLVNPSGASLPVFLACIATLNGLRSG
jgi:hypothetical protein